MAHHPRLWGTPRAQRAESGSEGHVTTPQGGTSPSFRRGLRAVREASIISEQSLQPEAATPVRPSSLPSCYFLPPTVPNPFQGTLETSLDAILEWGTNFDHIQRMVDTLAREVNVSTDWPAILRSIWRTTEAKPGFARSMTEELLCLVSRTLLPNQITENRAAMARVYDVKKHLAIRFMLRYDMIREWKFETAGAREHAVAAPSLPPTGIAPPAPARSNVQKCSVRPLYLPNIIPTLIAAPAGGFLTHGVRERMRHHVTDLDAYLMYSDEDIAGMSDFTILNTTCQAILHWQWLRQNNETLADLELFGWEELDGKADECEWIVEDPRKAGLSRRENRVSSFEVSALSV